MSVPQVNAKKVTIDGPEAIPSDHLPVTYATLPCLALVHLAIWVMYICSGVPRLLFIDAFFRSYQASSQQFQVLATTTAFTHIHITHITVSPTSPVPDS